MASTCDDCVRGVLHEGEPQGSFETVGGIKTYVSKPSGDFDKTKAVVYLGDIFGYYTNSKLICDSFAANLGVAVYFPDYLNDDPVPIDAMNKGTFDMDSWRPRHGAQQTRASLDPVLAQLKSSGVTRIAAAGYCFGGKYTMDLAIEGLIATGMFAHPAGIKVPEDLDALLEKGAASILVNACEIDHTWPKESQDKAEAVLGDGKYAPGFKQNYYPGCRHGFASRGDITDPKVKFGKEDSFVETVKWFKKYL
ncbi:alpha beta-hydrolase [Leucosporidium creatinivorum]|uniref:Alpha beta-hydrolase n=1 Tax=Leucosporidium creatinivorum TaxID=106004 RepID=A0A1Y2FI89_9BASI|nr:alpha beta-hydrolase [Leucosporidium creatinivorum]